MRAASIYYEAYRERSAEAMFNLGFMHEFGAGVPKDLSLAGKFYDMAKHTYPDAALPVHLAKLWLRAHAAAEWLRPRLPLAISEVVLPARLLSMQQAPRGAAGTAGLGVGAAAAGWVGGLMPPVLAMHWESLAGRVTEFLGFGVSSGAGEEGGDALGEAGETALLIVLLIVLGIVLKVRRQRQAALEARLRQELANGGGDARDVEIAERLLGLTAAEARRGQGRRVAGGVAGEEGAEALGGGGLQNGVGPAVAGDGVREEERGLRVGEGEVEEGAEGGGGELGLRQRRRQQQQQQQDQQQQDLQQQDVQ